MTDSLLEKKEMWNSDVVTEEELDDKSAWMESSLRKSGWLLKVHNQNPQFKWQQNLKLCPYETRNLQTVLTGKHGAGVACCFKNL